MNTKQLYLALLRNDVTSLQFDGIYAKDMLTEITSRPKLIICNTHPSHKPGEHWLLFYFNEDDSVDFYDSLGKPLQSYGEKILQFAKTFAESFIESKDRTQPLNSSLCGHYCLYYAYYKCKGYSMDDILSRMESPDHVLSSVKRLYNICTSSDCKLLQKCVAC